MIWPIDTVYHKGFYTFTYFFTNIRGKNKCSCTWGTSEVQYLSSCHQLKLFICFYCSSSHTSLVPTHIVSENYSTVAVSVIQFSCWNEASTFNYPKLFVSPLLRCAEFTSHGHVFPRILQFNWPGEGRAGVDQRREFVRRPRCFVVCHLRRHWRTQPQPNHLWHDLASRVQLQGSILWCARPADQFACKHG